jgi:hypothetical protein
MERLGGKGYGLPGKGYKQGAIEAYEIEHEARLALRSALP